MNEWDEVRQRLTALATDEALQHKLADMTQDSPLWGEEVHSVRTQLGNALTVAVWAAPAAPQVLEVRGQKYPDCQHFSGSDRTELRYWMVQLQLFIGHTTFCIPEQQSKMGYAFNRLRVITLGHILQQVRED